MTLDGNIWLSRGVTMQAFVRPLAMLQADPNASGAAQILNARMNFGQTELEAIHNFHADTLRFQISQPALDANSSLYDPNYLGDVINGVNVARKAGFVVMLMMQDEAITGDTGSTRLPTAETQSDWDILIPYFGADRGVVFELYNEPSADPNDWRFWLNGGQLPGQSEPAIGMQSLADHVRAKGAQNVLVLDGLSYAHTLEGVPAVTDALNRLVFAVHPYQNSSLDESQWDAQFGIPSKTMPVWADEWSAPEGIALGLGPQTHYQVAVDLLNYLRVHGISLCTGAFDVPPFVVQEVPGWALTDYDSTTAKKGSGTLVYNDFVANYTRQLTLSDGLSVIPIGP